jgi:hypothetical protein
LYLQDQLLLPAEEEGVVLEFPAAAEAVVAEFRLVRLAVMVVMVLMDQERERPVGMGQQMFTKPV